MTIGSTELLALSPLLVTVADLLARGQRALTVMEQHLAGRAFFVGEHLSLADLALFSYTHRVTDGGFDLARYPAVSAWLARCRQHRGVTEMPTP